MPRVTKADLETTIKHLRSEISSLHSELRRCRSLLDREIGKNKDLTETLKQRTNYMGAMIEGLKVLSDNLGHVTARVFDKNNPLTFRPQSKPYGIARDQDDDQTNN